MFKQPGLNSEGFAIWRVAGTTAARQRRRTNRSGSCGKLTPQRSLTLTVFARGQSPDSSCLQESQMKAAPAGAAAGRSHYPLDAAEPFGCLQ
jgi:hypothetical protein